MNREETLARVLKSDSLPTLHPVAAKLIEITSKEETTIAEIAKLIARDMSLSTKILKLANSAFYNFPSQISTINQAVSIIGINAVRSLVLSFTFLNIQATRQETFNYETFWEQSLATAVAARLIMGCLNSSDPEEIFIAGMLQNIGEMIIARTLPAQYAEIQEKATSTGAEHIEIERLVLGIDHAEIGYEITRQWHFPPVLITPIRYHHDPMLYSGEDQALGRKIAVVHLAGLMTGILFSDKPRECHRQFKEKAGSMLGFDEGAVTRVLDKVHVELYEIANFFQFKINKPRPVEDILLEANAALSVLNLTYEQLNKELITAKVELQKITRELAEKNRHLEQLANIDGLTEVYNHRYFQTSLDRELNRAIRHATPLCLILADVDNFKKLNDSFGHPTGDFILKELCRLWSGLIREYDLLARYGGEEFVFILPETTLDEAVAVAEKLRSAVAAQVFDAEHRQHRMTVSFGVAHFPPAPEAMTKADLIDAADKALLIAKKKGRNRVITAGAKKSWFGSRH